MVLQFSLILSLDHIFIEVCDIAKRRPIISDKVKENCEARLKSTLYYSLSYEHLGGRVESGLDDLDNLGHLGHFFGGSSGFYLQTKLSGCDPDITYSLENRVGI